MAEQKRRWGDRRDATLLRDVDSLHFIMGIIYPNRADNEAYIAERVNLEPIKEYIATKNYEGITFNPIYTLADSKPILPTDDYPGMGDYLRGSTVNGYVHQPWGIAQPCDLTLPVENNKLLKHELDKGSTMYNIRLDSAAKDGVDVADAAAPGDEGMSVTTVEDMHTALNGLDLK